MNKTASADLISKSSESIRFPVVDLSSKNKGRLNIGNRQVVTDHYFAGTVLDESELLRYKVFVRLGANKGTRFEKISFQHCIFDSCYLTNCVFDSCDFTGCRFIGSNFHQSAFSGCNFKYAIFERTQIDDDILTSEAPLEENLRMRFARSLRMNYAQIGDAKAVNKAISLELDATAAYLLNSWKSNGSYYQKKYKGIFRIKQFIRWIDFRVLDFIWGNGESIFKLLRTILLAIIVIAIYDAISYANPMNVADYWQSLQSAPGVFLGAVSKSYPSWILSTIAAARYIGVALLTALLVKRFGRR